MDNPLLDFSGLPRFDEVEPGHVGPALDRLLGEAQAAVERAREVSAVAWESWVWPLEDATERLARAWAQVSHLQAVVDAPALRQAYNDNLARVTAFGSSLEQDPGLYAGYHALAAAAGPAALSGARRQALDNALRDFRLGGAELAPPQQQRLAAVRQELAAVSARFGENVLDATDRYALYIEDERRLEGLPADVVSACRAAAVKEDRSGWKLGLQLPCYLPVQTYAQDRDLRETLYRAYGLRASETGPTELDNSAHIERILALRSELATLLGFEDYTAYSLAPKMAEDAGQVVGFLREVAGHARPHALQDRRELEQFAREELRLDALQPWDLAYASDRLRQARYSYSGQEVKRYFTQSRVLQGLFGLIEELYGLRVVQDQAPLWHPDVRFHRLVDAGGALVGQFYLDLYARPGKRGGAWMDDCRNRRVSAHGVQTPVVHLVCNFGAGVDGREATFSHDEVTTLFHEMGHGLHQLLTEVGELSVAGINGVEWDAVELPSQFMENFCWEWARVEAMTAHQDTGEPLPRELFDRVLAARNFQSGMQTVRQLEFALFDMQLHRLGAVSCAQVLDLLERVRDEVAVNRAPAWHRFTHQFTHVFGGGYAAGYYSYKWAEVLSADAYSAFEQAPSELAATGARFRREVLARGGSRPAMHGFVAFRGRAPGIEALLRHHGMAGQGPQANGPSS